MRYLLVTLMFILSSCSGSSQKEDTSLKDCQSEVKALENALEISEATNTSLKNAIKTQQANQDRNIEQLCSEGRAKVERIWSEATDTVSAKDWSVSACQPGVQVKMGVIDSKRKITSLQIKQDEVFKATRPFGWDSEIDRWHVLKPDLILEVEGCGTSTCEVTCHILIDIYQELPSCL